MKKQKQAQKTQLSDQEQMEAARKRLTEKEQELRDEELTREAKAAAMPLQDAMQIIVKHDICRVLATLLAKELEADNEKGYRGIQDAHILLNEQKAVAEIRLQKETGQD